MTPIETAVMNRTEIISMLDRHKVPWHTWGTGTSRTLEALCDYHEKDQLHFRNNTSPSIIIEVQVAVVLVTHKFNRRWVELFEDRQVFDNGEVLQRLNFNGLGETVRRNEGFREAAARCLQEELSFNNPRHYQLSERVRTEKRDPVPSEKWPGLMAAYHRHVFECVISRKIYRPDGYQERDGDRTIHFKWKPSGQLDLMVI